MKKKFAFDTVEKNQQQISVKEIECQKCKKIGKTKSIIKRLPYFKDIVIIQFNCLFCENQVNVIDFKQKNNDFGVQILFKYQHFQQIEREVIHSQNAKIQFDQLNFQIAKTRSSQITTIKCLIQRVIQQLQNHKISLNENDNNLVQQIEIKIQRAQKVLQGQLLPLTIRIRDFSGNSSIKNQNHPLPDKNIQLCYFQRTLEELMKLGFSQSQAEQQIKKAQQSKKGIKLNFNKPFQQQDFMHKQPVVFQVPCHTCLMPGQMRLCQTSIPYFSDLVIMSFTCQYCGAHSVQTKNSGQVHQEALEISLKIDDDSDLKRDLFKSETCKVCIPQAQLELDYGTLGGQYTTVEGLLEKVHDHLGGNNPFVDSDSQFSNRMKVLLDDLFEMRNGKKPFTLELIDPLSRSFLQNPFHPQQDKKAKIISRKRNEEQQDYLGFTGMNVDHYK